MATPNLGLTIPVGGTTPGASNNTTAGTYPYIESANLNLIDSLCYSLNNPAVTAGININADLTFNNHSITSVNNITVAGTATLATLALTNLSLSGTLGVTGTSTLGVVNGSGLMTLSGAGTALSITNNATVGGVLTVSGSGTALSVAANALIGGTLSVTGTSALAATTVTGTLSVTGAIKESTASTSLTLQGNSGASGTGVIVNSGTTTMTSGALFQVQNNSTSFFSIAGANGFLTLGPSTGNQIEIGPSGALIGNAGPNAYTSLTLFGAPPNATTGPSVIIDTNGIAMTSSTLFQVNNNAVSKFAIDFQGRLKFTSSTAPSAAGTTTAFGTTATVSVSGTSNDARMTVSILCQGAGIGAITVGQTLTTVTFGSTWAATPFSVVVGGANGAGFCPQINQISTTQFAILCGAATYTPITATTYTFTVVTVG